MSSAPVVGAHEAAGIGVRVEPTGSAIRRPVRAAAVAIAAFAISIGAVVGFAAYRAGDDPLLRGRVADAARWQAQANAYLSTHSGRETLERGREADAARWQAQAEAWLAAYDDQDG